MDRIQRARKELDPNVADRIGLRCAYDDELRGAIMACGPRRVALCPDPQRRLANTGTVHPFSG